jgi:hypothetical protein
MLYLFDLEQSSLEWHQMRYGTIGGTSAKQLFTKGDDLFFSLLAEKTEPFYFEDGYVSDAMIRGKELEPEARAKLSKHLGINFIECGLIINDNELLTISPDGITADMQTQCEIKCPEAKKHLRTCLADAIPLDNIHQCIHAFTVNDKLRDFYFLSYRPESPKQMFIKHLMRESEVNIGTEATKKIVTVAEAVSMAHAKAKEIQLQLNEAIEKLTF